MFEYLGHRIPETLAERLQLGAALLVVDLQRDFVHPDGHCGRSLDITGMAAVLPANAALIAMARRGGIPIVYSLVTQHEHGAYASPLWIADNLRYPNFEPVQCIEGTWGWHIDDTVAPAPEDVLLRKYRRSAFEGTNLANLLHARGVGTLVVSGVAATGCVESTVRDAIEKDFFVVVAKDCIGDAAPELVSRACETFDRILQPGSLATTDEIEAALASARDALPQGS
jgi:nicotinamidase-related amidase